MYLYLPALLSLSQAWRPLTNHKKLVLWWQSEDRVSCVNQSESSLPGHNAGHLIIGHHVPQPVRGQHQHIVAGDVLSVHVQYPHLGQIDWTRFLLQFLYLTSGCGLRKGLIMTVPCCAWALRSWSPRPRVTPIVAKRRDRLPWPIRS